MEIEQAAYTDFFFLLTLTIYRDISSAQRVEASEKIKAQ